MKFVQFLYMTSKLESDVQWLRQNYAPPPHLSKMQTPAIKLN
jgi:hypothetical protein